MIIFTVTSIISGQVYVGTTRNDLESQWEKMVAAAQQDMDYPLYREIRIHGEDQFTVEEWDRAEERGEMMELEEDAISHFNAKSLRGYKTSTVKILPKKKKRQRKSSIEKELATIFAEDDSDSNIMAPSLAIKSEASSESTSEANKPSTRKAVAATSQSKPAAPRNASAKELFQLAMAELEAESKTEDKPAENKVEEPKSGGSQANAVVQMNSINLGDGINAQLAAIQAAADAVLAGDSGAATEQLEAVEQRAVKAVEEEQAPSEVNAAPVIEREIIIEVPVCPKELRIREAIERHRKQRAQRSTESVESIKSQIADLLSDLDARARQLHTGSLAQVA